MHIYNAKSLIKKTENERELVVAKRRELSIKRIENKALQKFYVLNF
jgi:hypothetical protein